MKKLLIALYLLPSLALANAGVASSMALLTSSVALMEEEKERDIAYEIVMQHVPQFVSIVTAQQVLNDLAIPYETKTAEDVGVTLRTGCSLELPEAMGARLYINGAHVNAAAYFCGIPHYTVTAARSSNATAYTLDITVIKTNVIGADPLNLRFLLLDDGLYHLRYADAKRRNHMSEADATAFFETFESVRVLK